MLKNKITFYTFLGIFLLLIGCSKDGGVKDDSDFPFGKFIPLLLKDEKNTPNMTKVVEGKNYIIQQFDEVTFIVKNKKNDIRLCIKYSGGDNIYLDKNYQPTAIFLLNKKSLPISMIYFEKNTSQKKYTFSKIEYLNKKVYKLATSKDDKLNILSMKISDVLILLKDIELEKYKFVDKEEMPDPFYETPLWEISW